MSRIKITVVFLLAVFAFLSITLPAEAQRRRKKVVRKTTVVRTPNRVHHRVVVRRAHVRYHHLPRWGAVVTAAPAAAVVIRTRNTPFYFHDGIYYTPRNSNYVVVRPSPGIRIKVLPAGHRKVIVGPGSYYYYYGIFYAKADRDEAYEVVEAPEGAIVDALPEGYEIKTVNETEYYVLDDVYYAEVDAPEFEDGVGYEVVKI
jgi:hypothetical protein